MDTTFVYSNNQHDETFLKMIFFREIASWHFIFSKQTKPSAI